MGHAVGLFSNYTDADRAVQQLTAAGIDRNDISVVASESTVKANPVAVGAHGDVVEGAGDGAVKGAIAGLLVGVAALALPGVGPLFVAGPIASILASTAAGATAGAVTGGLQNALVDMGIGDKDAVAYVDAVNQGGVVVTVNGARADEARRLLRSANATRVNDDTGYSTN